MTRDQQRRKEERIDIADPTVQAKRFWDRVRSGEIDETKAMLLAYAGEPVAKLACNLKKTQLRRELRERLPQPPRTPVQPHSDAIRRKKVKLPLFADIPTQFRNLWRWNLRYAFGYTPETFLRLPLPAAYPNNGHCAWTLVPRLASVQRTAAILWAAIRASQKRMIPGLRCARGRNIGAAFQYIQMRARNTYEPGLRWECLDMFHGWDPEDYEDDDDAPDPDDEPEIPGLVNSRDVAPLAAAAQHGEYTRLMDGETIPFIRVYNLIDERAIRDLRLLKDFMTELEIAIFSSDMAPRTFACPTAAEVLCAPPPTASP